MPFILALAIVVPMVSGPITGPGVMYPGLREMPKGTELADFDYVAKELSRNDEQCRLRTGDRRVDVGRCGDARVERHLGQEHRVLMPLVDGINHIRIASPQHRERAGTTGDDR